jgi:hypothetical protein
MKKKIKWKKELVSVMWRWSAPGEFSLSNLWRIFTDTLSCLDAENLRQMNITSHFGEAEARAAAEEHTSSEADVAMGGSSGWGEDYGGERSSTSTGRPKSVGRSRRRRSPARRVEES